MLEKKTENVFVVRDEDILFQVFMIDIELWVRLSIDLAYRTKTDLINCWGDIATYIPPPTIPEVSGDVVATVG